MVVVVVVVTRAAPALPPPCRRMGPRSQVGDKWRAQVGHMEGGVQRKYYSSYVRSAAQAARDADR